MLKKSKLYHYNLARIIHCENQTETHLMISEKAPPTESKKHSAARTPTL